MKRNGGFRFIGGLVSALPVLSLLLLPAVAPAATSGDYCVRPAFIGENVKANLLLMIDNSSSMYDLSYADLGSTCSVTASQSCKVNTDCPSGETCTVRQPFYCFDETYRSSISYAGYFASGTLYNFDFTNKYFTSVASFPDFSFCNYKIDNQLCVGINATNRVNYFTASGNYLNWLTSSKMDVEKQILTGGKVVSKLCSGTDQSCNSDDDCNGGTCSAVASSFLQAETRGCDGQGFVKSALTADFVNFSSTDSNTPLGVVFLVHGPVDSANASAPSRGGQSYIDIYAGTYNYGSCQQAMTDWGSSTVTQSTLRDDVAACLNYNSSFNFCSGKQSMSCKLDSDCVITTAVAIAGGCANNTNTACFLDTDCPTYTTPGICSNSATTSCTSNTNCAFPYVPGGCSNKTQSCNTDPDCGTTIHPGVCSNRTSVSCTTAAQCNFAQVIGGCDNGNPYACVTDLDCTYVPSTGAGGCTNTGQTCTSSTSCNNSCSNSLGTACRTSADCPTGRCNNAAAGTGSACTSNTDCSSFKAYLTGRCSNVTTAACTVNGDCPAIGSITAGHCNNTATSGTGTGCTADSGCTSYKAYHSGYCSNFTSVACNTATQGTDCLLGIGYCNDISGTTKCITNSDCSGLNQKNAGHCANSNGTGACTYDSECKDALHPLGYCSGSTAATCTGKTNQTGTCLNEQTATCSAPSPYPPVSGTCSSPAPATATCSSPAPPSCSVGNTCTSPPPNVITGHCNSPTPQNASSGTCSATTTNDGFCNKPVPIPASNGTCNGIGSPHYACSNPSPTPAGTIDYSPCVDPSQSAIVKTKVSYQHVIQTCWKYFNGNSHFSPGDYTRETNACGPVLASWGVCSGTTAQACGADTDCPSDQRPCVFGPSSIRPGNPAIICGMEYLGQFCTWNATTKTCDWAPESAAVDAVFASFCSAQQPTVIDPTDSATTSTNMQSVPPILNGIGLESQLGGPIGSLPVRINVGATACGSDSACPSGFACLNSVCTPSGLVQQFGSQIRVGAMDFNFNGSASEAGASGTGIQTPQCCSNNTSKLCTMAADCGDKTCGASYCNNLDGGKVIYPIGLGTCAKSPSTACANDVACGSGDTCVSSGIGSHASGLINVLDGIRANAWTPFAEGFYNALGYFAVQKVCDNSTGTSCKVDSDCGSGHCTVSTGKSRTDLRINSGSNPDYNELLNPSQFPCQQNYVLLITDGSSTADQNPSAAALATANVSGGSNTPAGVCSYFAGSSYLPTLSWLAKNRNLSAIPAPSGGTASPATVAPIAGRDSVTTYVVTTGGSNGQSGECNSTKLLSDTAMNGGTTLRQANNPQDLAKSLQSVFQELAAKSASGTAASILSNSEGSGANILQAIFFPRKIFDAQTEGFWMGELNNLWYYVDPFIGNSSTREDTDGDHALNLRNDYVLQFGFDNVKGVTTVKLLADTNGDGTGDANPNCIGVDPRCVTNPSDPTGVYLDSPDSIKSLWKAGKQLWARDLTDTSDPYGGPRTIYTVSSNSLVKFSWSSPDNSTLLQDNLQYPTTDPLNNAAAIKLMKYVHGFDYPGDTSWRSRTVKIGNIPGSVVSTVPTDDYVKNPRDKGKGVWKLGDIISSTPRVQSSIRQNGYNLAAPSGYNDGTYGDPVGGAGNGYIGTTTYKSRGMVYVGGNDGMLHAFRLGVLNVTASGDQKATLTGTGLGNEAWSFIPENALPYLKYYGETGYKHLYYLDGATTIVDASVATPTACSSSYWDCTKDASSWRSILVGGMGIGGASRDATDSCKDDLAGTCVKTPITGLGYSSYYALDITTPDTPHFLWEFSDAVLPTADQGLGFATSGPAIVKIGGGGPDHSKNGRWFAVFGSGPTGPIDKSAYRFMGTSNQPLKVYVVDLNATPPFVKGTNYWVLTDVYSGSTSYSSTVLTADHAPLVNAFAGSLVNGSIDADRWNFAAAGNYQDDAVYFGYSQANSDTISDTTQWTKGGILKVVTSENPDPSTWKIVKVIDGIGPVTTGIGRLQDRKAHKLWLYFGTGRYYYLKDDFDTGSGERLYGLQDLCYRDGMSRTGISNSPVDSIDPGCATLLTTDNLTDQTSAGSTTAPYGWYITLDPAHTTDPDPTKILGGERSITDPVAMTNGAVFFSTYQPNNDFCQFGGRSFMWAVKYDTGTQAPAASLQGRALVQVSTGQFKEVDLSTAFTDKIYRRMSDKNAMTGKPPSDSPPIVSKSNNKPVRRIIHMQER
jgi:type IV pilus assembly protein PilY1